MGAVLVSCDKSSTEPEPKVVTVTVYNRLDIPVSIASGGTVYGTLESRGSTVLTLPPQSVALSWTNTKRRYSNGSTISDDLGTVSVSLAANENIVDITNVANGMTYFTPNITKSFPDTIALEVARGGSTICLGYVFGQPLFGFTFGYYALAGDTQLRYYRGSSCRNGSVPYRFWNTTTITNNISIGSGYVSLNADVLP